MEASEQRLGREGDRGLTAACVAALTIAGLVLRVAAIGHESLWSDEALTAILAHYPWWSLAVAPIDPTPPLFYWLEQALVPAGAGPAGWRMVSLVAGVATVPLAYWLGRELHSRGAGLVAAGLVAASAPLIDYSQEARAYALLVAMIAGSAAALAALSGGRLAEPPRQKARRWMLAIFALFTAFASLSHFIAIFWVFPALAILVLAGDRQRRLVELREVVVTLLAIAPILLLELRRAFLYRSQANAFTWLEQASPARIAQMLADQWLPFARPGGWAAALAGAAGLAALLWAVRAPLSDWVRSRWLQAGIVALLLVEPAGLWLLGALGMPVAMPRTLLPAVLGMATLVGVAIAMMKPRMRLIAGSTAVLLSAASTIASGSVRPKEQWAGAAEAVGKAPIVVVCANWKTPAFMAAGSSGGWLITASGNHALVVRHPGDRASWHQLYFDRVQRLGNYPLPRDRPLRLDPVPMTPGHLLFVASECGAVERSAFARWANVRQAHLRWSSPTVGDAAGIRVEDWQLDGATPLRLWIVR